ncbi:MAG: hypothetical protein ACI9OU_002811 [Candidatus Promineifilaceae bacterium]|jgi:hypothetical protein
MKRRFPVLIVMAVLMSQSVLQAKEWIVYEGDKGPGKGKHIVFIASDHEYRGEETCPAIARILAKRYGFKCTVLFGQDENGHIKAGSSNVPGMEAIDSADMLFTFLRFLAPDDASMQHFEDYLDKGGPVLGLRTTTHAFKGLKGDFEKYNYNYKGEDYAKGFGRQILGETWAGHYGQNHKCSTRLDIIPEQAKHPVLIGVENMHAKAGAYDAAPMPNSVILANNQVLKTMAQGAEDLPGKPPRPAVWVRTYKSKSGTEGRVFCSTQGASEDIVNDGVRRCIINGVFWCMGMESDIKPDMNIDFVGPYKPRTFSFGGEVKKASPEDIQSYDAPIWKH